MMTKRKPVLPELTLTIDLYPWTGRADTAARSRAELRAAEAVIRAARRAGLNHYCANEALPPAKCPECDLERALARIDALTRPTQRKP